MGKRGCHMNAVVVMKKRSHRVFALIMGVAMLLMPIFISIAARISVEMMLLCFAPVFVIACPMIWHTLTWKLCFDSKGITNTVFGFRGKTHGYQEIRDAVYRYSSSDSAMIVRIVFADGKSVKFRVVDENAQKARKYLLSHHSIRQI